MTTDLYQRALKDAQYSIVHHINLYNEDEWPADPPMTSEAIKADMIREMFYQVRAVFMADMPLNVRNKAQMSAQLLIHGGNQATARELGHKVQVWRDNATNEADAALRAALLAVR